MISSKISLPAQGQSPIPRHSLHGYPWGSRRPVPRPTQPCQHLSAPRLVSFRSGRFPNRPDFPVVGIFVGCTLDTVLRTMSQTLHNFLMSHHFPRSSRGLARCAVHCPEQLLGSWVTECRRAWRETQPSLAPQQPGSSVHRLREPLCPGEAVPLPRSPGFGGGRRSGGGREDRAAGRRSRS